MLRISRSKAPVIVFRFLQGKQMKYFFTGIVTLALFWGCATTTYTKPITKGSIENTTIIKAVDGSFSLSGEFTAPFNSKVHYHSLNIGGEKFLKGYEDALQRGAKKVTILENGKTYYGVLALDDADERGFGPALKSYKIIIPKPYFDATEGGKISLVYEYYHIKDEALFDNSDIKKYSWMLWLSDKDIFK